jgi:hypothetical protein
MQSCESVRAAQAERAKIVAARNGHKKEMGICGQSARRERGANGKRGASSATVLSGCHSIRALVRRGSTQPLSRAEPS